MNERITLKQKDKNPYGFYAARKLLPLLFPDATIIDDNSPVYHLAKPSDSAQEAVILTSMYLNADKDELEKIVEFVKEGNHVFIITKSLNYKALEFFGFNSSDISNDDGDFQDGSDSLAQTLSMPRFIDTATYIYPGKRYSNYYNTVASAKILVLGRNRSNHPTFIQLKAGLGNIFIHTAPLAFSNYFLLHKNNISYMQQAFSLIPDNVSKVVWNEYYLTKRERPPPEPNWLSVLFQYESFKWAFITAISALLIYVISEMRRRQRLIPLFDKPKNDSLDFVQTIGRLYYDRKDHKDLGNKMSLYFLEHIRNRYKISTDPLDETFMKTLHTKSGYPERDIQEIVRLIIQSNKEDVLDEGQLSQLNNELEKFYQNT